MNDQHGRLALDWLVPSTRQNSLITDLFLLYLSRLEHWLPAAGFVRLLGDLGVPENSARTGLHRMTKGGFLCREARAGVTGYASTPDWQRYMSQRYEELLHAAVPFEGWTLVSFSIPEVRRSDRHVLRSALARMGFGTVASGLWIRPGIDHVLVAEFVRQLGYADDVNIFTAHYHGSHDLPAFAGQCWDLDTIDKGYQRFLDMHEQGRPGPLVASEPRQAFVDLTVAHNQWRLVVQEDPCLPAEALSSQWTGQDARRTMDDLTESLHAAAFKHVKSVLNEKTSKRKRT